MARFGKFFLVPLLVLVGILAACAPPGVAPPEAPGPKSWTADLSAAHLGIVTFVAGTGDEWRPGVYFKSVRPERQAGNQCEVRYDPGIFEKPLAETGNPLVAQIRFAWSLVDCGLSLPENDSLRRRFEANHQPQAYGTWLGEYFDSCGESLYRLGWKFDPETDADLACVPDWKGVVAGYPDGVPGHISRPINVSMDH